MATTISTRNGKIAGVLIDQVLQFKGIPYAKPPLGELRFKRPQAVESWQGSFQADNFGAAAIQEINPLNPLPTTAEDCLSLNIWVPEGVGKRLPVMIWLHGGSFTSGAGSMAQYDGHLLAKRGQAIIVNLNYRLGALGFAHFDAITDGKADSNLGLRDQILGIQWVKDNIEAFGGNPDNITLFGESAGAMSIACLLASPQAEGLFQKAIVQSGSADHVLKRAEADKTVDTLLQALEIKHPKQELWQKSAKDILRAQRKCQTLLVNRGDHENNIPLYGMTLIPMFGDDVLPQAPIKLMRQGTGSKIPLIIGTTAREWEMFLRLTPTGQSLYEGKLKNIDENGVIKMFNRSLPEKGTEAYQFYKSISQYGNSSSDLLGLFSDFETDRSFAIPSLRILQARERHTNDSYHYLFAWDKGIFGACHGVDIPFVFGATESGFGKMFCGGGAEAAALADKVQDAWLAFAKHGHPECESLGLWPNFSSESQASMVLDQTTQIKNQALAQQDRFWQSLI